MNDKDYYTDVKTDFGRCRANSYWAILSKDKPTNADDCRWDRKMKSSVKRGAEKRWRMRPKTKPFRAPLPKKEYLRVSGEWFPTSQVIRVSKAVGTTKAAVVLLGKEPKTPALMVFGPLGRGIVASMNPSYVAEQGKRMGQIQYGDE